MSEDQDIEELTEQVYESTLKHLQELAPIYQLALAIDSKTYRANQAAKLLGIFPQEPSRKSKELELRYRGRLPNQMVFCKNPKCNKEFALAANAGFCPHCLALFPLGEGSSRINLKIESKKTGLPVQRVKDSLYREELKAKHLLNDESALLDSSKEQIETYMKENIPFNLTQASKEGIKKVIIHLKEEDPEKSETL